MLLIEFIRMHLCAHVPGKCEILNFFEKKNKLLSLFSLSPLSHTLLKLSMVFISLSLFHRPLRSWKNVNLFVVLVKLLFVFFSINFSLILTNFPSFSPRARLLFSSHSPSMLLKLKKIKHHQPNSKETTLASSNILIIFRWEFTWCKRWYLFLHFFLFHYTWYL